MVSYAEVKSKYDERHAHLEEWSIRLDNQLEQLRRQNYESMSPVALLECASDDERQLLADILKLKVDLFPISCTLGSKIGGLG